MRKTPKIKLLRAEIDTIREVFFMSMLDEKSLTVAPKSDFLIDDNYLVEVGEKNQRLQTNQRYAQELYCIG